MDDERRVELVKEFYDLDITHDISNFENVDCNIYSESTSDGYEVFIVTNNPNHISVCEDIHYYDHNLNERFNDHIDGVIEHSFFVKVFMMIVFLKI